MAKLFKHLGIGGKKVSDQPPCHQEFMSGKTSSGSVQELRSTSPSKNRASAIVAASNSWLGSVSGVGPAVSAEGRRHSDASSIRSIRSRLPTHPRTDLSLRGARSRGPGSTRYGVEQCDGRGGGQNGARSTCSRPDCVSSCGNSPQIATEYSVPFDLKLQIKAEKDNAKPDIKMCSSEDDYCVPYEVLNENATDPSAKDIQDESKMLPITKTEVVSCVPNSTSDTQQQVNELLVRRASAASSDASVAAAATEELQKDDPPCVDDAPSAETKPDSAKDFHPASETGCDFGSTPLTDPEKDLPLINPSAGMYDAPWDLWATQKHLEEKLKAAQTPPPGTSKRLSQNATVKDGGATATECSVAQKSQYEDATMQIYDEPWDKRAEDLQQSFLLADRFFDPRRATSEASLKFESMGNDLHCALHRRPDQFQKLKQCKSVGDPHKIRTSIRTGVGCCYPQHSPMCTVQRDHSLGCRHSPDCRRSTSQLLPDCVDEHLPLEKQTWYHGSISRVAAEELLRSHREGSYLVRTSESNRQDYSLSLKSSCGDFMHMKIVQHNSCFILGQFSQPFDSIPQMILYYTINKLPIRGTEHMTLSFPVCSYLL